MSGLISERMSERVSSGSAEVDHILGGGFLKNSINVLLGQPGTGKTVLAQQLVFRNAAPGRPILYVTTLAEPLPKVVKFLQKFEFFDASLLGNGVIYDDIGPSLARKGLGSLLPYIHQAIRELAPKIILIDSFRALHDLSSSPREIRQLLHDLTGVLTAYDTTTFLLGEYTEEQARELPEFAVADGIVQLLRNPHSTRDERFLRVLKLRGSAYLEGQHSFRIGPRGLSAYPRLVSPDVPAAYERREERISTGVPGLDELVGGGFLRGTTTILAGPTGCGKTTMGLQFALEGLSRGEHALYVNFQENPSQLAQAMAALGTRVEDARQRGLSLYYSSPVEMQIDGVIVSVFETIRREGIRRVVIDAIGDLIMAAGDAQRVHYYLYALIQHLAVLGVTCVLIQEATGGASSGGASSVGGDAGERLSYLSDNILLVQVETGARPSRTLTVLKSRGTAHDLAPHTLQITGRGVTVVP
jgi:circadian clock protein KaiC